MTTKELEAFYHLYKTGGVCTTEFDIVSNALYELDVLREMQKQHTRAILVKDRQIELLEGIIDKCMEEINEN